MHLSFFAVGSARSGFKISTAELELVAVLFADSHLVNTSAARGLHTRGGA